MFNFNKTIFSMPYAIYTADYNKRTIIAQPRLGIKFELAQQFEDYGKAAAAEYALVLSQFTKFCSTIKTEAMFKRTRVGFKIKFYTPQGEVFNFMCSKGPKNCLFQHDTGKFKPWWGDKVYDKFYQYNFKTQESKLKYYSDNQKQTINSFL